MKSKFVLLIFSLFLLFQPYDLCAKSFLDNRGLQMLVNQLRRKRINPNKEIDSDYLEKLLLFLFIWVLIQAIIWFFKKKKEYNEKLSSKILSMFQARFRINPLLKNVQIIKVHIFYRWVHYFGKVDVVVNGKKGTFTFKVKIDDGATSYAFSDEEWEKLCHFCISNRG